MATEDRGLFAADAWTPALKSYSAATHLTVALVGPDGTLVGEPVLPTPMFDLLAGADRDPGLLAACARRCLAGAGTGAPVVEEGYGLAVVGMPLVLAGRLVGAAVAAYVVTNFLDQHRAHRLAVDSGVPVDELWAVLRKQVPLAHERVLVYGELLKTLCTALLSEHERARQLEEASARFVAEGQAKDDFLAVLSHELRTPLTAMLGWARMLRSGTLDAATVTRALDVIERNTKIQADLIEDLLYVSRIVSGKVALDLRPLRLAPIIDAVVDMLRPAAYAKNLRLEVGLDPAAPRVSADPERASQVISNLLSNAIKFTGAGGRVAVTLTHGNGSVRATISDTGIGIAPEFLPLVFERFRQAENPTMRAHSGLGLGLTIVRHLVELHGGTVTATSPGSGRGAAFTVSLPALVDLESVSVFAPMAARPDSDDHLPELEGLRVLVIDDEPDARDLFARMLEQHSIEVKAAASVDEALAVLERWKPHVLVSDIGLPGKSGYDLIRLVRRLRSDQGRDVPALALTAYAHPEERARALASGFQLHMAKPVEPVALALAVARLAGRLQAA